MKNYIKVKRESMIDNLIRWINETKSESFAQMMKDDLKMLMNWKCEYILSNTETNDYKKLK